jgi:hypothetical protein
VGAKVIQAVFDFAKHKQFGAIRISSVKSARDVWKRWGFREADTFIDGKGRCQYGRTYTKAMPHDVGDNPTYRMTLKL